MNSVRDLMSTDVVAVAPSATVMQAAALMFGAKVGSVLVVDDGVLVGIFTERDIVRALSGVSADAGRASPVRVLMTPDPTTIDPDASVGRALDVMLAGGFRHLVVMQGPDLLGVVSMRDLAGAIGSTGR
jgi:CBS domain-containing protein